MNRLATLEQLLRIRDATFNGPPLVKIYREILKAIKPETDAGLHSFVIEKTETR